MQIIDGKVLSEKIYQSITKELSELSFKPKLAIILASNDPASRTYVDLKVKKAEDLGIETEVFEFSQDVWFEDITKKIEDLNEDESVHGILVQLPIYQHISKNDEYEILSSIDPAKDVDCLTYTNLGKLYFVRYDSIWPATVDAISRSIEFAIGNLGNLKGMNVLIINNSNLIGKPLFTLLSTYNATVTVANKESQDLKDLCLKSDIIVSATGQTNLIDHTFVSEGSTLIDVTSVKKEEKVIGDFIHSTELYNKAAYITPVPGGIGPLTIASLFNNLIRLIKINNHNE